MIDDEERSVMTQREDDEADPETTTPDGCECTSHCGCGSTCNIKVVNDWCYTGCSSSRMLLSSNIYVNMCLYMFTNCK